MGGIPTNLNAQVIRNAANTVVPGLYSAGESACVSVHGANRLGTNSLVDLLVFGRRSGRQMAKDIRGVDMPEVAADVMEPIRAEIEAIRERPKGERKEVIRTELADVMMDDAGVYRDAVGLERARAKVAELKDRYRNISVDDKGKVFNTDLLEARELGYLLDCAETMVAACINRKESRGAHSREDYPERDDVNFLTHSLATKGADGAVELAYKPVTITKFQPKPRIY
jgi:succinate dehydrogenase / fumarate reductase flavoprotein subunit